MKYYSKENVYDAALSRIRYLFDEFDNVVVGFSGGKDSTICLQLSLIVAEELLKLKHITGFSKLFKDTEYKKAWETKNQILLRNKFNREETESNA